MNNFDLIGISWWEIFEQVAKITGILSAPLTIIDIINRIKNNFSKDILISSGKNIINIGNVKWVVSIYVDIFMFFGVYTLYLFIGYTAHYVSIYTCFIRDKLQYHYDLGYTLSSIIFYILAIGQAVLIFYFIIKKLKEKHNHNIFHTLIKIILVEVMLCPLVINNLHEDMEKVWYFIAVIYLFATLIVYWDSRQYGMIIHHENKFIKITSTIRYLLIALELGRYGICKDAWHFSTLCNIWMIVSIYYMIIKLREIYVKKIGVTKLINLKSISNISNGSIRTNRAIRIDKSGLIYTFIADNKCQYIKKQEIESITYTLYGGNKNWYYREWLCKINGVSHRFDHVDTKTKGWAKLIQHSANKKEIILVPIESVESLVCIYKWDFLKK